MLKLEHLTIRDMVEQAIKEYGDLPFLSFVGREPVSFAGMGREVSRIQGMLRSYGVEQDDRVAILGPNMPNWVLAYLAVTSMGAVAVPLMPEFTAQEIVQTLGHSASKVLIASEKQIERIGKEELPDLTHRIILEELCLSIKDGAAENMEKGGQPENFVEDSPLIPARVAEDELAAIIYTSGTTGNSKGVMLSHRNIVFDAMQGYTVQKVTPDDVFLSILPLAHTYENTLGMILPLFGGARIYYLDKPPTASVLVPALKEVRPTCMLSVPLVIEKIFKNSVHPNLTKGPVMSLLYKLPPLRKLLHNVAGKKLFKTFGGRMVFFGIGGSKLDGTVERFLREARFPFAIGYGLTETSPLIAGGVGKNIAFRSTGPALPEVEVTIDEAGHGEGQGEILVRGKNVMKGYYKRPDLTGEVLSPEGWLRTGDLGCFDKNGNLHINGRIKNMIIGANGKNIMPEDIESVINTFGLVVESIVVKQKGKLVALVHLNRDEIENRVQEFIADTRKSGKEAVKTAEEYINEHLRELLQYVNTRVNKFSRLQGVLYQAQPFEKTATQKIKRYLYG